MTFLTILAAVVGVYLLVCLAAYFGQRQLVYHPVSRLVAEPSDIGLEWSADTVASSDGSEFLLWRIGESDSISTLIVYFHGNAENVSHNLERYQLFHSLGAAVWAFEYRGYAGVGNAPSEKRIEEDLGVVINKLQGHYGDGQGGFRVNVVPYGRSLGGGVAVKMAARVPVAGLVLESTFSSMHDVARATFPILPAKLLLREQYASVEAVATVSSPKLVMHGEDDEVIPYRLGRKLYDAAVAPKRFVELPGGHNSPLQISRPVIEPALRQFLAEVQTAGK